MYGESVHEHNVQCVVSAAGQYNQSKTTAWMKSSIKEVRLRGTSVTSTELDLKGEHLI